MTWAVVEHGDSTTDTTLDTTVRDSGTVTAPDVVRTSAQAIGRALASRISIFIMPIRISQAPYSPISRPVQKANAPDRGNPSGAITDDKVESMILGKMTGLSAGEEGNNNGLWISGSWTDLENDLSSTAYDGDSWLVMGGYDVMFTDRFLFGVAVGYDQADLDTTFNTGTLDSDGLTISPYAAYLFTDSLSMDLLVSYSDLGYDTSRTNRTITGSYDATRVMFSSSLTYYYFMDKWNLSGKLGYMYSVEEADRFTESDGTAVGDRTTNLGEIRVGGRAGYYYNNWEPYFSAYYLYDSTLEEVRVAAGQAQPDNDKDEIETSLGVNYTAADDMRLSLEVIHGFLREDIDNTSVLFNFRWEF